MLYPAFLYSFQSNKETENQKFKISLGRVGCLPEEPLSDMEREAFLETIQDLKESIKHSNDMIRSLQDTIRSLQSELDRSRSHSEQYLILITDLQKKLDEREKEISDLHDLNNRHNKMTFGNI